MKPSIKLHKPTSKAAPSFSGGPRRSPGLLYSRERQVSVGYATGPDGSTGLREKEGLSPTSDTHIRFSGRRPSFETVAKGTESVCITLIDSWRDCPGQLFLQCVWVIENKRILLETDTDTDSLVLSFFISPNISAVLDIYRKHPRSLFVWFGFNVWC